MNLEQHASRKKQVITNVMGSSIRGLCCSIVSVVLIACNDGKSADSSLTDKATGALPRAIADLRSHSPDSLSLSVAVNGNPLVIDQPIIGESTEIAVTGDDLRVGINQIAVEFTHTDSADNKRILATGTDLVDYFPPQQSVVVSGVTYEYADSDLDGIYNVHELAVESSFDDGDELDFVDDPDSDNDGMLDGVDSEPYGPGSQDAVGPLLYDFTVVDGNGTETLIRIDEVVGGVLEVDQLDRQFSPLSLSSPTGWPVAENEPVISGTSWTAFALKTEDTDGLCANVPIAVDTSSLKSSVSNNALLYFRRSNGAEYLSLLGEAMIDDLDFFERAPPLNGDGPYNDSLRVIFIPMNTVGWMDLYADANYSSTICTLNLTTPHEF